MERNEDNILDYETCKRLKEIGYDEIGELIYTTAVIHNGRLISFDEECELESEGRGGEIEYIEGGDIQMCTNMNSDGFGGVTAVSIKECVDWLSKNKNIEVETEACCGILGIKCYTACVKTYTPKPKPECWDEIEPKSEEWDGENRFIQHERHILKPGEEHALIPAFENFEKRSDAYKAAIRYAIFKIIK